MPPEQSCAPSGWPPERPQRRINNIAPLTYVRGSDARGGHFHTARDFRLSVTERDGALVLVEHADGRELLVVTGVDSAAFSARWLEVVAGAG